MVAIEDTYPDPRYDHLPALRGIPRVLLVRRLDGESFDILRTRGAFLALRRILLAEGEYDLAHEGHSGESVAAATGSPPSATSTRYPPGKASRGNEHATVDRSSSSAAARVQTRPWHSATERDPRGWNSR